MTIIDNKRDAFAEGSAWGQRLFHNSDGKRASLTGQRISDFKAQGGDNTTPIGNDRVTPAGLNMVLLIQVPLKQKERPRREMYGAPGGAGGADASLAEGAKSKSMRSDVEAAVIGHGELESFCIFQKFPHLSEIFEFLVFQKSRKGGPLRFFEIF